MGRAELAVGPVCVVSGCDRPVRAKAMCTKHYARMARHGTTDDPAPPYSTDQCGIDGCDKRRTQRGWCSMHYIRWYRHGDPLHVEPQRRTPTCAIGGCDALAKRAGLCPKHWYRFDRFGDPHHEPVYNGSIFQGYRVVGAKGHPVANKHGRAFEHRVVLYDAIGPEPHPCRWCGTPVRWDVSWPAGADALVVDHINNDRLDNRVENLAPSCQPCNVPNGRRKKAAQRSRR